MYAGLYGRLCEAFTENIICKMQNRLQHMHLLSLGTHKRSMRSQFTISTLADFRFFCFKHILID